MAQTFQPLAVLVAKLAVIAVVVVLLIVTVIGLARVPLTGSPVHAMNAQPIPFSHKHHVGDVGLDCRLCHATVENSATPGLPSAQVCLTCHSQLFADQAMFEPLRRAATSGQPIAWTHVNRLPDYVYFDHSVHVAKGVACIECHGRLDQMPLVSKPQAMDMKWCIACHQNPSPHLRAPADVFQMPPHHPAGLPSVVQAASLERRLRLTDCSTCHR